MASAGEYLFDGQGRDSEDQLSAGAGGIPIAETLNRTLQNFNLRIERKADKDLFVVCVMDDKGRDVASHDFRYDFNASLMTRLEDSVGKNIQRNAGLIKDFGSDLFGTVFGGEVLALYRSQRTRHLRMKLFFRKREPELLRIPWEFMFDGEHFISANHLTTVTRVLKRDPHGEKDVRGRLKMLVVISSPLDLPDYYYPRIEEERKIILQALDWAFGADRIEIDFLERASRRNIRERLRTKDYHILHFIGHGIYAQREHLSYLLLEDEFGSAKRVDINAAAGLLSGNGSLRLVVLSGFQTAMAVGHRVLADLPPALLLNGIPAVITMQYSVTDRSAMNLAREFYSGVSRGLPLDLALTGARLALLADGGQVDFGTPILYADEPGCLSLKNPRD